MSWLAVNSPHTAFSPANLRIISNSYGNEESGESSGVRLCQWLQKTEWKDIPFLLFCGDTSKIKDVYYSEYINNRNKVIFGILESLCYLTQCLMYL